jgi:hypothetical protein
MSALGAYNLLLLAAVVIALAVWLMPKAARAITRVVLDERDRHERKPEEVERRG